jgi:hypothetical protein
VQERAEAIGKIIQCCLFRNKRRNGQEEQEVN